MSAITNYAPLLGRILVGQIFLLSGINKVFHFSQTAAGMAAKGLPMAELLLVLTIIIEVGGSLMIILGWRARLAAIVFFLWLIPVTLVFHDFWAVPENQKLMQLINFQKNIAIMGAMLYIMAFGSGPYSIKRE